MLAKHIPGSPIITSGSSIAVTPFTSTSTSAIITIVRVRPTLKGKENNCKITIFV